MGLGDRISNMFKPRLINIIVIICLMIILILVILTTGKIDLFSSDNTTITTSPVVNNIASSDFLTTFINKYVNNIQQKNNYAKVLATQEQTIQNLTQQVENIINSTN